MSQENQIIELSQLTPQQILYKVKKMLQEDQYEKFMLLVKRKSDLKSKKRTIINSKSLQSKTTIFGQLRMKDPNRYSSYMEEGIKNSLNGTCLSGFGLNQKQKQNVVLSQYDDIAQAIALYNIGQYDHAIQGLEVMLFDILQQNKQEKKIRESQGQQIAENCQNILINAKKYGQITLNLANCYYRKRQFDQAIKYYKMESQEELESSKGQRLNNLGSCYAMKQQTLLSLKSYSQALKIYQNIPDIDCSNLLNNIGILYFKSGMYDIAAKYFLESINARKGKSRQNEEVLYLSYFKMGQCLKHQKKYEQSLNSFLFALNLAEKKCVEKKTAQYANTLKQLGLLYETMQKWQDALTSYQKLSDIGDKQANKQNDSSDSSDDVKSNSNKFNEQGYIYQRVAGIHQKLGNTAQFKKFMKISYQNYRKDGNMRKMSQLCMFSGNNHANNNL